MEINDIIERLLNGDTYRKISKDLSVPLSTLFDYLNKTTEHSARVAEALSFSADTYSDKAEQVLIDAISDPVEISRAKELSQLYKWKASKRSPKKYGDKLDVTSDNKPIANVLNIGYSDHPKDDDKL